MAIRYLHELAEITAKEVIVKNPSSTIGFTHLGTIHNNSGNNYIRGSIIFSRNKNDITWDSGNAEWTRVGGSSNDFSAILHTSSSVRFLAGSAVSTTTTYTNTEFLNAFEYMRATTSGDVTFFNNVETQGEFTIRGNYAKLFFQDTGSSPSEDAYIVNNADGLFFGKTNSPTASNDILKLDLSDSSAVFSGIIKAADGTAATPAYNFSSHDGNGMYLEEYDATNNKEQVSISTDGTRRFRANEAGVWSDGNFYVTNQYRKLTDDWWEGSHGVAGRGFRFRNTTDGTIPFTVTSAGVLYGKAAGGSALYLQRDDTTISGTNTLGSINFQGDDPTDGTFNSGAAIFATSDGSWASGSYPGRLDFQTRNTTGSLASALTLNSDQSATFAGDIKLADDNKIKGTTYSAGFISFESDGETRISANDDVVIGYGETLNISNAGVSTFTGKLRVDIPGVTLANQPLVVAEFDGSGTDGLALISVDHTTTNTASALGSGIRFKTGDGSSGSNTKSGYIFMQGAQHSDVKYIAPKTHTFYVDGHDDDITGTTYNDYGTVALHLAENGNLHLPEYIYHYNNAATYLRFQTNRVSLYSGGGAIVDLHSNGQLYFTGLSTFYDNVYVQDNLLSGSTGSGKQTALAGMVAQIGGESRQHFYHPGVSPNRLAGANIRYTVTATKNGSSISVPSAPFQAKDNYINYSTANTDTFVFTITGVSFSHGSHFGVSFSNPAWRAKDVQIERSTDGGTNWTTVLDANNQSESSVMVYSSTGSTATNAIRYTLTNFNTTSVRISHFYANNYAGSDTVYPEKFADSDIYGTYNFQSGYGVNISTTASGTGLTVYTGDASTAPNVLFGRNSGEYIGFSVGDRHNTIIFRQDETTGNADAVLELRSSSSDNKKIIFRRTDNSGASPEDWMTLTNGGNAHILGTLSVNAPSTFTAQAPADDLVVGDGTSTSGITIYSDNSSYGAINFANDIDEEGAGDNPVGNRHGVLRYNASLNQFQLRTGGNSLGMTVTSSNTTVEGTLTLGGGDFKIPATIGNAGQVLKVPSSGTTLEWADDNNDGGVTITNDANNRLTTAVGNGTLNAEANLTFDGSTLGVTGNITMSNTDPTITLVDSSGANTDPNGTIIFSEVSGTQNFDINYNGASDRLEFRGRVNNNDNTDLVYINRDLTTTLEVLGGATFDGDVTVAGGQLFLDGTTYALENVSGNYGIRNSSGNYGGSDGTNAYYTPQDFFHIPGTVRIGPKYATSDRDYIRIVPAGTTSTIEMPNENAIIHNNQGNIVLRTGASTDAVKVSGSNTTLAGHLYPSVTNANSLGSGSLYWQNLYTQNGYIGIMYDRNDTNYYVSPNTTSVLRKDALWESMGTITIRSEGENHLRINRSGSGYSFALYNDDLNDDANNDATNWEVEFDMLMNSSTHQGFAFNVVDINDFYAVIFRDSGNTVRVQKQVNGTQTYPIAETNVTNSSGTAIDLDDGWHHVRIQKSGVYIVIEVDGVTQVSTSIEDTLSHTYGKMGFTTYDNQCEYKNIVIKRGATQTLILGSSVTKGTNNYGVYADDNLVLTDGSLSIYPHRRGDYGLNATTATSTTFRSKLNIWSDNEDHITFGGASTHMVSAWEAWKIWINNDSANNGTLHLYHKSTKTEFARFSGSGTSFVSGNLDADIFRDLGSTAYYADLANSGTSLHIRGTVNHHETGTYITRSVSSWGSNSPHTVLKSDYSSAIGDYVVLKATGNTTTNHGVIVVGDDNFYIGRINQEDATLADENDNQNPLDNTAFRVHIPTGNVMANNNMQARNLNNDAENLFHISRFDTDETLRRKFDAEFDFGGANTNITSDNLYMVEDGTAPADGVFEVVGYQNRTFGDYVLIDDETEITFECWVKYVAGTTTNLRQYAGASSYDSSKTYLGNTNRYWGVSSQQVDTDTNNTGWHFVSGTMIGSKLRAHSTTATAKYLRFLHLFNYSTDSDGTTWNRTRFCGYRFYKTKKTVSSIYLRKNTGTYTSPGSFQSTEAASKTLILDNAANLTNIRTLDVKLNASNSTYSHPTEALIKLENNSHNYISFRTQTDTGAHSGLVFSDNNRGGYITFQTYVGSGTNDGTNGDSMFLGAYNDIVFQTGGSNTIAGKTERFRIKQNGNIDSTFFDASGTSARFTMQQNAESELQLYNNRQDLSNVPVSSIVGYNASQVAKLIFYRGGGSSSGYIKLQTKSHNDLSLTDVATFGGNSSNGTTANTDSTFHGNISHQGLTMSTGTDVDQVKSYNMTFQLAANTWTDTGINGSDLSTGTYAMQVYIDDHNAGGGHYEEHYSAMISWFAGGTNSGDRQDEIVVHRAGHAPNNSDVQFRTQRHSSGGDNLMLQVKQNFAHTTTMNNTDGRQFNFKFRRLI